jgi:CTD kinase subunit alpha
MLELFTKKPVFQGTDEMHQLEVLYKFLGTPSPNDWPKLTELPWFELVKPRCEIKSKFRELFQK